jgi:hypothetical protein
VNAKTDAKLEAGNPILFAIIIFMSLRFSRAWFMFFAATRQKSKRLVPGRINGRLLDAPTRAVQEG